MNTELWSTYWNIGKIIAEHEQENQKRADYGKQTLKQHSKELTKEFGKGFLISNLQFMRRFYQCYQIQQTVSVKLSWSHYCELLTIFTSLYERLLLSEGKANKKTVLSLAEKGIEMATPLDIIKAPVCI